MERSFPPGFVERVRANIAEANERALEIVRDLAAPASPPVVRAVALPPPVPLVEFALPPAALLRARRRMAHLCTGCGCPRSESTDGCLNCKSREYGRSRRAVAAVA